MVFCRCSVADFRVFGTKRRLERGGAAPLPAGAESARGGAADVDVGDGGGDDAVRGRRHVAPTPAAAALRPAVRAVQSDGARGPPAAAHAASAAQRLGPQRP